MANHKSAEKRARQTIKKTERNRYYKTKIKNIIRNLREACVSKDETKASEALKVVNQDLHKFASKGILTKNTASRKVGRLHQLYKKTFSQTA